MDIAAFKVSLSKSSNATALRAARARSSSSGAMERYMHRFESRESSPPATHKYGDGQQTSGAMERYAWVQFAGKLTICHTTHIATVSISAGRWNVTHGFDLQENSPTATKHIAKVSIPVG